MTKKLLLIDGNAIFHRAFHALPLFQNDKGECTNAIYGFTKMLFDIIQKEKPDYLATTFDHKDPTFRHEEFAAYKANRAAPPDELYPQMPRLMELLRALDMPIFQLSGFEADDIIGTLARQAEQHAGLVTHIVTGDKDTFQLVSDRIHVVTPLKGISQTAEYDPAAVIEKTGLRPDQIIDYKALRGDASDNIPGVKGIGEKQAVDLLQTYDNLDNIYAHLDELTKGQREKLERDKEIAYLSQKMATIDCGMPIKLDLAACQFDRLPDGAAQALMDELNFKSLAPQYRRFHDFVATKIAAEKQQALF